MLRSGIRSTYPGYLTSALGLFALVYGFSNAETHSWSATATIVALVASPVLLTAFVLIERRAKHPLLPLHIIWDRARGGAYTTIALAGAGIFAVFLFLTYFLQQQLGLSPLTTGLAFLPLTGVLVITSTTVQTRVIQHTGVKPLVLAGLTLGAIAMFLFTRLTPSSSYASNVLPGLLVLGVGMGCIFAPAFSTATLGVEGSEAGVASAMVNTSQQVGGSVGTSLLSTIFASAVASYTVSHLHTAGLADAAAVHGYTTAFRWSVGIFALGFLLAMVILPGRAKPRVPTLRAALARLSIGNCHYSDSPDGARRGLTAKTRAGGMSSGRLVCAASACETLPRRALRATNRSRTRLAADRRVELELKRRRLEWLARRSRPSALGPVRDHVMSTAAPVRDPAVQRLDRQPGRGLARDERMEPPPEPVDLDDVPDLNAFEPHPLEG